MNFTSSPFERMMKEKPRPQAPAVRKPPRGSACYGWSFLRGGGGGARPPGDGCRGIGCVSCYKELLKTPAGGR